MKNLRAHIQQWWRELIHTRKFKIVSLLFLLWCGLFITVATCERDPAELALRYMRGKYGEDFVMLYYGTDVMTSPTTDMTVRPTKHADDEDWDVEVSKNKENGSYADNYVTILLRPQAEELYRSTAEPVFENAKILVNAGGFTAPSSFNLNTTLEQALEYPLSFSAFIFTSDSPSKLDEHIHNLELRLKDKGFTMTTVLYYVSEEDLLKIDKEMLNQLPSRFEYICSYLLLPGSNYKFHVGDPVFGD